MKKSHVVSPAPVSNRHKPYTRIGKIGELAVSQRLLTDGYHVYQNICDDDGVDMVVEDIKSKFYRVQVKHVHKMRTGTSLEIKFRSGTKKKKDLSKRVDVMAIYYEPVGVAFYPYKGEETLNLALHTAKNNQEKGRQYFYQYMRFPSFE